MYSVIMSLPVDSDRVATIDNELEDLIVGEVVKVKRGSKYFVYFQCSSYRPMLQIRPREVGTSILCIGSTPNEIHHAGFVRSYRGKSFGWDSLHEDYAKQYKEDVRKYLETYVKSRIFNKAQLIDTISLFLRSTLGLSCDEADIFTLLSVVPVWYCSQEAV